MATLLRKRNENTRRVTRNQRQLPPQPHFITKEEGTRILDTQARKYLGMSGREFRSRYRSGELSQSDYPEVNRVSLLIPLSED